MATVVTGPFHVKHRRGGVVGSVRHRSINKLEDCVTSSETDSDGRADGGSPGTTHTTEGAVSRETPTSGTSNQLTDHPLPKTAYSVADTDDEDAEVAHIPLN